MRHFQIIKAYAEDGKATEIENYSETEFMALPIHPFIKECAEHPDFDHIQFAYFTKVTTYKAC